MYLAAFYSDSIARLKFKLTVLLKWVGNLMFEYTCTLFIGLQYIWEYRSPSKSAPPHYQCKLCVVQQLQNEIAAHITGWKHSFRYMVQSSQSLVNQILQISSAHASDIIHILLLLFLENRSRTTKTRFLMRKKMHLKIQPSGKQLKLLLLKSKKLREEVKLRWKTAGWCALKIESYTSAL